MILKTFVEEDNLEIMETTTDIKAKEVIIYSF
jgi:hypothetical protein